MKFITFILSISVLAGCTSHTKIPDTLAEKQTSYSYIPFDPLPVQTLEGASCSPADNELRFKNKEIVSV